MERDRSGELYRAPWAVTRPQIVEDGRADQTNEMNPIIPDSDPDSILPNPRVPPSCSSSRSGCSVSAGLRPAIWRRSPSRTSPSPRVQEPVLPSNLLPFPALTLSGSLSVRSFSLSSIGLIIDHRDKHRGDRKKVATPTLSMSPSAQRPPIIRLNDTLYHSRDKERAKNSQPALPLPVASSFLTRTPPSTGAEEAS